MTYAAVVTPVEVCVTRYHERYGNELEVLPFALNGSAWVVYTIFLVDTGLQFVTAYFEETVRMWVFEPFYTGQEKGAKFPTSKAHISVVFHSFWLIFGRV